ncbi:OmpA family protein [uncultured Dokdonia sp.]|uniref:OmpA family protein n=1 Tax=uncultured Dokdonia sp. TaxID=575653 RepID=UPI0026318A69|nr:OmpA family protein [uncultured Dokdonia sp.]
MISVAQIDRSHETFFDTDQYDITKIEIAKLNRFIASLPKDKIEDISIYGYCDDRGSDAYNKKLSQQRADAIKAIFSAQGISDTIIKNSDGKGELLLTRLDDITNEIQRKLNRKVEIIVSIKQPKVVTPEEKETEKEIVKAVEEKRYKSFTDTIVKGDRILLDNILFKINYSYIKGSSYKNLRTLAKFLKENDNIIFKIQGHVCCVGKGRDAIDLKTGKRNLSVSRAKFVYDYLAKNGVSKKRMRYEGFGSKYPLGGDTTLDRRVEILVTYVKKKKKK